MTAYIPSVVVEAAAKEARAASPAKQPSVVREHIEQEVRCRKHDALTDSLPDAERVASGLVAQLSNFRADEDMTELLSGREHFPAHVLQSLLVALDKHLARITGYRTTLVCPVQKRLNYSDSVVEENSDDPSDQGDAELEAA
jgi:hypothetical protein